MSTGQIKAIKFEVQQVGKKIKGTKRRYLWVLSIGQRMYNFILDDSLLSGKSKLIINGRVFHCVEQSKGGCNYNHTFIIDGCLFNINYANDFYQMKINNNNFSHFLGLEKKKDEFQEHKVDQKSFDFTDFSKPVSQKKITINLPGLGNGMKKKKTTNQSDDWNSFCQAGSFNPFAPQPTVNFQLIEKETKKLEMQETKNVIEILQFNKMQDLFKTICKSSPYEQKVKVGQTPTYQIEQIPALPQINLQEFSTIQQLFATKVPVQTSKSQPISQVKAINQVSSMQEQKKLEDDFNTMRQIFQTMKLDFFQKITTVTEVTSPQIKSSQFNTMQELFATQVGLKVQNQLKKVENKQKLNFQEFNTIQNMVDTKNINKFTTYNQDLALSSTNKLNNTKIQVKEQFTITKQKPNQVEKPKWDDFNTIQNLFKTNAQSKKQNQFWKF